MTSEGGAGATLAPLIVTLRMDAASAAHFPAHRNWLDAHVTLFHALPGEAIGPVMADIADVAAATPPFVLRTDRVLFFGAGVAFALASVEADALRRSLAGRWSGLLGRQDRAWRGPLHITVQNKTDAATARALHDRLVVDFVPRDVQATGIDVWHYEGGPWRHAATTAFGGESGCARRRW